MNLVKILYESLKKLNTNVFLKENSDHFLENH